MLKVKNNMLFDDVEYGRYKVCLTPDCDERIYERFNKSYFEGKICCSQSCYDDFRNMLDKEVNRRLSGKREQVREMVFCDWNIDYEKVND